MKSTLAEILSKFNLSFDLDEKVKNLTFRGDYKIHTFENNKHIFKDENAEFMIVIDLDDLVYFVNFQDNREGMWSSRSYSNTGEMTLVS